MTNLQKLVIAFAIFGSIGIISSVHGVDPQDYDEAQKEDEPLNKESVTEYPNGVNVIPGQADIHYPIYSKIPKSAFSCSGRRPGFYADTDLRCQVWHICDESGVQQSFLCTNGTIYSQDKRVCDWWYNVNCDPEEVNRNYEQNSELYKGPPPKNNNNNNDDFEDNDLPPPPPTRKSTPPPPPPQRQHYEQQQQNQRRPAQNDERQQREREQAPSQSQQSRQRNSNERPQSPPPQQQNHQQQQNQRPHGNPPPPGTPEKKRVIVLRLPGPLPPGATIPPHVLMQYAESVLAAERAGKPPPTGLAQSASQNSVSNYNVHRQPAPRSQEAPSPRPQQQQQQKQQQQQQQTETPAPRQVSQEPAQARPAQQPPARPTPRGPIVPYTPRPFSQFLEDAVRFNGQTKTSPPQQQQQQKQNSRPAQAEQNYRPPQPVQTSPRPSQERKPTPSYNEPRPQAQNTNYEEQRQPQNNRQNNNYQQEQRQQAQNPPQQERTQQNYNVEGRQTSPPQQQQNRQNYEEQRRNDNQNQNNRRNQPETPERQNQNHEEQRRQNAQQIITNYERQQQKQSENEYRQQQSEEQYSKSKAPPQTPIPHKKSPPKPKFAAPPADSHKKFRHSTPRKHGEVKFAPKSASALEDQDFEVPEESRRPAYPFQFNNFQPVPHLSAEAEKQTPRPRPIKENHHVKTVQEKPRVKYQEPIQVQQKPTEEYRPVTRPAVQIQPKTTEEEPIVRRLVVVARQGLKIKDPRAGADRSSSSEQIEQFQKSRYESVKVNSDVPTTSTTKVPTTLASEIIPAETTRSPTRRLIKKKILRSTTLPPTFGTTSAEDIVIPDVHTRKVTRAPYESKKVQQKFYDAEDDVHVPYETTRAPQTPTIVVRKQQIEKATYAPQPQVEHVTKATQDLGFDVYGRNPEEDEEEELLKAAQELQANENYGKRKRPSA